MVPDPYQVAYQLHQSRKKQELLKYRYDAFLALASSRHSIRTFKPDPLPPGAVSTIQAAIQYAPSSCNRKGVSAVSTHSIPLLSSLLVGGRNWLEYAPHCLLFFADPLAYKAPGEITFMPYLDTGFLAMHLQYTIHSLNLASCFINPNIRPEDIPTFNNLYNNHNLIFTGALPFGLPF